MTIKSRKVEHFCGAETVGSAFVYGGNKKIHTGVFTIAFTVTFRIKKKNTNETNRLDPPNKSFFRLFNIRIEIDFLLR